MTGTIQPPAPNPCGSCPYRRDVPSGVWEVDEYEKLVQYDADTGAQPLGVFLCHRQDGRACAGWVATHDMDNSLALRMASSMGIVSEPEAFINYKTSTPTFDSGTHAAEHGMKNIRSPDSDARKIIDKLTKDREVS